MRKHDSNALPSGACPGDKQYALELRVEHRISSGNPMTFKFCAEGVATFSFWSENVVVTDNFIDPNGGDAEIWCGHVTFNPSTVGQCRSIYFQPELVTLPGGGVGDLGLSKFINIKLYPENSPVDIMGPNDNNVCEFPHGFNITNEFSSVGLAVGEISLNPAPRLYIAADIAIAGNSPDQVGRTYTVGPDVKIIQQGGGWKCTDCVFKGCSELWEGIELETASSISLEGSTIQDAHLGINILDLANLSLKNNIFKDNVYSISSFGNPTGQIEMVDFENNLFVGTGSLKPHVTHPTPTDKPKAGIRLSHTSLKNLSAPSFSSTNRFENLTRALASSRGTAISAFNTFVNCDLAISMTGAGATGTAIASNNAITNCDEGIYFSRIASTAINNNIAGAKTGINVDVLGPLSMNIKDNTISASRRGIRSLYNQSGIMTENSIRVDGNVQSTVGIDLLLTTNITVDGSDIRTEAATSGLHSHLLSGNNTIAENTINIDQPNIGTNGIYLENSALNMVSCNLVQGDDSAGFTESFGILNENSDNNTFNCNGLSNVEIGINHVGMMSSVEHTGNEYGNGRIGLMIGRALSQNSFIKDQVHKGDNWTGTFDAVAGRNWNINGALSALSQFTADGTADVNGNNFYLDPSERLGPSNWFVNDPGTTLSCGQEPIPSCIGTGPGNAFTDPNGAITFIDAVLTADTILTDNEEWVLVNETYYWILTQIPTSSWDTQITDFMDDYADEPQGEFAEIQALLDEAIVEDAAITTISAANAAALSDYIATGNNSHLSNMQTNNAQLTTLMAAYETNKAQKLTSALTILQGITATNLIETDYEIIYEAMIGFMGNPNSTVNTALLTPLADKCSTEYPRSVAMSRALLNLDVPQKYDTWDQCGQGPTPRSASYSTTPSFLYPNPTDGLVYFDREVSDIEVRDLTGRLLLKQNGLQQNIDLTEFRSGIYVILYMRDGALVSQKLVKQ